MRFRFTISVGFARTGSIPVIVAQFTFLGPFLYNHIFHLVAERFASDCPVMRQGKGTKNGVPYLKIYFPKIYFFALGPHLLLGEEGREDGKEGRRGKIRRRE